eukprot:scaffold46816_cov17-Prasinocladus_malaysianus.AAC.1
MTGWRVAMPCWCWRAARRATKSGRMIVRKLSRTGIVRNYCCSAVGGKCVLVIPYGYSYS